MNPIFHKASPAEGVWLTNFTVRRTSAQQRGGVTVEGPCYAGSVAHSMLITPL